MDVSGVLAAEEEKNVAGVVGVLTTEKEIKTLWTLWTCCEYSGGNGKIYRRVYQGGRGCKQHGIGNNCGCLAGVREMLPIRSCLLQVGGGYVPWNSFGYVPDTELLQFAAKATSGGLLYAEDCINLPAPFPHRYRG